MEKHVRTRNQARKARLTTNDQRREALARLVAERHNNPDYAQRTTDPATGDRVVSMLGSHPYAAELADALLAFAATFVRGRKHVR